MFALIAPNQQVSTGFRVAQISVELFEISAPLFWVECSDEIKEDVYFYDNGEFKLSPLPKLKKAENQPTVIGAQTL